MGWSLGSATKHRHNAFTTKTKKRRAYYELYTGTVWGEASNCALCLDSVILGIEKCVAIIESLF